MINGNGVKFKVNVIITMALAGVVASFLNNHTGAGFRIPLPAPEQFGDTVPVRLYRPQDKGGLESSMHDVVPSPPTLISQRLKLGEKAEKLEALMIENGITDKKAIVCLLATAKHESGFNSQTIYKEKNGSVSRGVFQFNSRGLGRGVPAEKLHRKEYQVKHLVSMKTFRQWYGEVKTKSWEIETAMTELTKRIIRCAKIHYAARVKTSRTWWRLINED